jgi:hypothetical protein
MLKIKDIQYQQKIRLTTTPQPQAIMQRKPLKLILFNHTCPAFEAILSHEFKSPSLVGIDPLHALLNNSAVIVSPLSFCPAITNIIF